MSKPASLQSLKVEKGDEMKGWSGFGDTLTDGLFGGSREKFFLGAGAHPLAGIATKKLLLNKGKMSYDLSKQELAYKEAPWDIKVVTAEGKKEVVVKNECDKNLTATFGVKNGGDVFLGGRYGMNLPNGSGLANLRLYTDMKAELSASLKQDSGPLKGFDAAADALITDDQKIKVALVGCSYKLPFGNNATAGLMTKYVPGAPFAGLFGVYSQVPASALGSMAKKATVGMELIQDGDNQTCLVASEVGLDAQTTIKCKASVMGKEANKLHASIVQDFKDLTVTMGLQADLANLSDPLAANIFGCEVKVKK